MAMVVLDTNVVSEMMRDAPAPHVVAWLNDQETSSLFLTTISVGEIAYGLWILPQGWRRRRLEEGFARILAAAFASRILPLDEEAAQRYGEVMGRRRKMGRPLAALDGQIAAIAWVHGHAVATRNVRDFADCGVEVINPFEPWPPRGPRRR